MPRARSPNRDKAFQLWIDSQGQRELKDIAAELGVSPEQVRKWKHADGWDAKTKKVTLPNGKGHVTKRKQGGQPGNKNAVGNRGGAPPGNKNGFRHGAYERIMADLLEADEAEVFNDEGTGEDVEAELRRTQSGVFEQDEKGRMVKKKGTGFFDGEREDVTVSRTTSVFEALNKLEAELDRVQGKKIKVLSKLEDIRVQRERLALEKKRLDGQTEQSKLAVAWIAALTGEEVADDDEDVADG